jgi:hypothetical protein
VNASAMQEIGQVEPFLPEKCKKISQPSDMEDKSSFERLFDLKKLSIR